MGLSVVGRVGRRTRLILLVAALFAAALAALWAPPFTLLALAAALALLLWDRVVQERSLRQLAAAVAGDLPELKLEVGDDAWGELCHALNRLRQQRRAQQQLAALLPALPVARAVRLADAGLPPEGLRCEVAVLALADAERGGDPATRLSTLAAVALEQAHRHEALLVRSGERLLLIFGALAVDSPAATLRVARDAARALAAAQQSPPRLALAAGSARTLLMPGLGVVVFGDPVDQALALPLLPPGQLLCNEDAYLGLRRLGALPAQAPAPQRSTSDRRPAYLVQL